MPHDKLNLYTNRWRTVLQTSKLYNTVWISRKLAMEDRLIPISLYMEASLNLYGSLVPVKSYYVVLDSPELPNET